MTVSSVETRTIAVVETIKEHNGFNYAVLESVKHNSKYNSKVYGCNCSFFDTEEEVKKFIEEIA